MRPSNREAPTSPSPAGRGVVTSSIIEPQTRLQVYAHSGNPGDPGRRPSQQGLVLQVDRGELGLHPQRVRQIGAYAM